MNHSLPFAIKSFLIVATVLLVMQGNAQTSTENHPNGVELKAGPDPSNTLQFSIAIPEFCKSSIIREDQPGMTVFKFANGNADPVFLFDISRIQDQDWAKVKDQIPNAKLLDHRGDVVYFTEKTSQINIKGPNADA